jgi:hypothetical protein
MLHEDLGGMRLERKWMGGLDRKEKELLADTL